VTLRRHAVAGCVIGLLPLIALTAADAGHATGGVRSPGPIVFAVVPSDAYRVSGVCDGVGRFTLDFGDRRPVLRGKAWAVPQSLYYYALGEYRAVLTVTMPQTPCSWEASGGRRFWTKITEFRISCRTKGVKCAQSESTRFERPVPRGLLPEGLPRPRAGVLVPVLPGGAYWGEALERLVSVWGNPQLECMLVLPTPGGGACNWPGKTGSDLVGVLSVQRGKHTAPEVVRFVSVSSYSSKSTVTDNRAAASRSRLKGWRTSRGVHVGMTWAKAKRRYPTRLHCAAPNPGTPQSCGFLTAPYRLTIDGHGRRQVFGESFRRATPDQPLVNEVSAGLAGDEGRCRIYVRMEDQLDFSAFCSGPLKSARFRFTGEGRILAANAGKSEPYYAIDDEGHNLLGRDETDPHSPGPVNPPAGGSMETRLANEKTFTWETICERFANPPVCFPDRPTLGTRGIWPAGVFEIWELGFGTYRVKPSLLGKHAPPGGRPSMPQFTFTAEFVGMPNYTITSSEQGASW
jgi:hypothetical protein